MLLRQKRNKDAGGLWARLRFPRWERALRPELTLSAFAWLVILFFIVYPVSLLVIDSFRVASTGRLGFQNYKAFFSDLYYFNTFVRTCLLSALVLLTTTVLALPLAYILARYKLRGMTFFTALTLLPIVLPAYAGAFAWVVFFGRFGTFNLLLMQWGLISKPLNLLGFPGLVIMQSLHLLPFMVLSLMAAYTSIDPALEEAAEVEGASGVRRFFTITLPLSTPSYLAGAVLVFLWPFTDWLTPLIFGVTDLLPTTAYINIAYHFTDVTRRYMGIVSVVMASAVCVGAFLLLKTWVERKRYTGLSKGTLLGGRTIKPTFAVRMLSYLYVFFISAIILIIPVVLALSGFSRRWVLTPFPRYWTLENFRLIFAEAGMLIYNSFRFTGVALLMGVSFGLLVAYLLARTNAPGRAGLEFVNSLMLVFPGVAVGVAFLRAFWYGHGIPLATHWIIMPLALFVRRLPYFLRMAYAAYQQLDPSLEEAAEVAGAGKFRTFATISVPLLLKGIFVGVIMFFIMAFQEISTAIFLYRGGWETLPIGLYLNWHRGMEFGIASAMAFLMVCIVFVLLAIAARIGGGILKVAWGASGRD
ncbi:MAG: iron ABC transporter permease [Candidatus Bipolaricaulota bacterium]|nr:iron ABC transporter permease [Candidatus Bipolaricaulota bacterium]MDW8126577.1 iron ABC transporter permease [Candidatus Bipolaricaulota bacterium]